MGAVETGAVAVAVMEAVTGAVPAGMGPRAAKRAVAAGTRGAGPWRTEWN